MKGMILAGGKGTRLYPLTRVCNKHLLPVGFFPMIYYPLVKLRDAGIKDVLIVTGREDLGDFAKLLGSGDDFGIKLTYRVQDRPGGIAEALLLGKEFIGTSPFVVILADNLFEDDLSPIVKRFSLSNEKARILLKELDDPSRFGIAIFDQDRILSIEEKPVEAKSRYAVTGIYMYRPDVFEVISRLSPSSRGELEVTDVNNYFIGTRELSYEILQGWWEDAGTMASYHKVNQLHHSLNFCSNSVTKSL